MAKEKTADGKFYGPVLPGKIARLAILLAVCLIALSTTALISVGIVASHEADKQMTASQLILLRNALQEEFSHLARDQMTVAHWDAAVENIAIEPNKSFMTKEVSDALLNDFAHDRVYLIGPDRKPMMVASPDAVDFEAPKSALSEDIQALAEETTDGYRAAGVSGRRGIERTRIVKDVPLNAAHYAFGEVEGKTAFLSAMPILPEGTAVKLPSGAPVILVSVRFFSDAILSEIATALHFDSLRFGPVIDRQQVPDSMMIASSYGQKLGSFKWETRHPGPAVWRMIVPLILALALIFSAVAVSIAIRIGKVSAKLELSEQANKLLALQDSLTGLSNRLHFNALLDERLRDVAKTPFALIACDLDRFKAVNDTYGHAAGDFVIRETASRLKTVVGKNGVVARIGGDEFIVLVDAFTDVPRLSVLSQEIILKVVQSIPVAEGEKTDVGISLGIAVAHQDTVAKETLMHDADEALYEAKAKGRGRFVFAHRVASEQAPQEPVSAEKAASAAA